MIYRHIIAKLFDEFSCIADKCPANCCSAGWSITWTAQEVSRLSKAADSDMLKKISTSFSGDEYQTLLLNEQGECPFLTNGLCSVQRTMGEQYLSYTCRQYPRISRLCGDIMISSCRPTCYAVMDKLFNDKECMQLQEIISEKPMEAIITDEQEIQERLSIFSAVRSILWDNDTEAALIKIAAEYGIEYTADIKREFRQRYGWDIITSDKNEAPEYALKNIVTALFMEWLLTRYDSRMTALDNVAEFIFRAQAVILAVNGAVSLCSDRTEMLCSISDMIAAL